MNRGTIIGAVSVAVVIFSCAAGGTVFASKMESSNNSNLQTDAKTKAEEVKQELKEGWKQENGSWHFYKNNVKQTEWVKDNNSWYYLGNDGKMRAGWIKDKDQWYYLNGDGTMATNITIDGYYLNDKGLMEKTPIKATQEVNESQNEKTNLKLSLQDAINLVEQQDHAYIDDAKRKYGDYITGDPNNVSNMLAEFSAPVEEFYLLYLKGNEGVTCTYIVG